MNIQELRNKMCIPAHAGKDYITKTFNEIAEVLIKKCVIKDKYEKYRIIDFEFYYYNSNHQDISAHPRNSEALCWYINDFGGIDLNFKSEIKKVVVPKGKTWSFKYELTDDAYFGGILIRQIQRISDGKIFDGPLKVAELFRTFDATCRNQNNPILVLEQLEETEFKICERYNLLGSHKGTEEEKVKAKVDYNLKTCFTEDSYSKMQILEKELTKFNKCKYRYIYSK